jgi:ParB family chromosome partitioning protein
MSEIKININEMTVPVDKVKPNAWNPNEQTPFMRSKLQKSLQQHGYVSEVVTRELPDGTYEILDGEHRYDEARKLGATTILINNLGTVPDDDARLVTMAANEIHGSRNPVKLSIILNDLRLEPEWGDIKDGLPFNDVELNTLLSIKADAPPPPEFTSEGAGPGTPPPAGPSGGKSWIDIRISVHRESIETVNTLLTHQVEQLGLKDASPDPALVNGMALKRLAGAL